MKNIKTSNERLNKHKTDTNEMINENKKAIKTLTKVNPKYQSIDNIPKIYMDKIHEIYNDLNKESIDFWSNDFILREPILFHLKVKTFESTVHLKLILEKIILLPNITIKNPLLNEIVFKNMQKEIEKINEIKEYIKNYSIKENLIDTLIDYFENVPIEIMSPGDITIIYYKIKENIEALNLKVIDDEKEQDILKIVFKKEEKCIEYNKEKQILNDQLRALFEEYVKENNIDLNKTKVKKNE